MAGPRSDAWMVTVFDDVWVPEWKPAEMDYMVWQRERCPETQRLHVHVYIRYKGRKYMNTVKRSLGREDAHVELRKGDEKSCRDYCTKEESRVEAGTEHGVYDETKGRQGKRTDLEDCAAMITAGRPMVEVAQAHPGDFIRYHRGFEAFANVLKPAPPVQRDVMVTVFCGPTGTGKTHRVLTQYPDCYSVPEGKNPWDQYSSQPVIFLDEFDWKSWPVDTIKKVLDKWRYPLACRYNNKYAEWTHVVICANSSPVEWYNDGSIGPAHLDAFRRRIRGRCYWVTAQEQTIEQMDPIPI